MNEGERTKDELKAKIAELQAQEDRLKQESEARQVKYNEIDRAVDEAAEPLRAEAHAKKQALGERPWDLSRQAADVREQRLRLQLQLETTGRRYVLVPQDANVRLHRNPELFLWGHKDGRVELAIEVESKQRVQTGYGRRSPETAPNYLQFRAFLTAADVAQLEKAISYLKGSKTALKDNRDG